MVSKYGLYYDEKTYPLKSNDAFQSSHIDRAWDLTPDFKITNPYAFL